MCKLKCCNFSVLAVVIFVSRFFYILWLDRVLITFNFSTFQPLLYTQGDLDEVIKAREDEWVQRQVELERKVKTKSMHVTVIYDIYLLKFLTKLSTKYSIWDQRK